MSLYEMAEQNEEVHKILIDPFLNHQEATDEINNLFSREVTSRTSVRRARDKMGVRSPNSPLHLVSGSPDHSFESRSVPVEKIREFMAYDQRMRDVIETFEEYPEPVNEPWPEGKPATVVVVGDYQIGYHDRDFIEKQCEIIRDVQPDIIISTGDDCDFSSISKYAQGLPDQFGRTIHEERQMWVEDIAPAINEAAPNAIKRMCDSNHIRRLPMAIEKYIPGLRDAPELFVKNFLKLDELGWVFDDGPTEFLPGVIYSHGDEFNATSRTQATKHREVIKTRQANIVFGHTHQAALNTTALGYGYNMETYWSLNVGHGMQMREAKYIKSTSPDWSRGIGIIHYDGVTAYPELHLEVGGKIRVDGVSY